MINGLIMVIGIIVVLVITIAFHYLGRQHLQNRRKTKELQEKAKTRVLPEKDSERYNAILEAIDRCLDSKQGLEVYYMPIYSVKDNKVVAAEALLRMFDDKLGEVSPEEFIPIAEENGRIIKLGHFTLHEVCKLLSQKRIQEYGIRYIEINLSIEECLRQELMEEFKGIIESYEVDFSQINLEIKESALMLKHPQLAQNMDALNDLDFSFSLDEYGTAASTMAHIITYPFQIVKVDKSMLWSAMSNNRAMMAFCASINMVKDMHMKIVIEGVESQDMVDTLKRLGCDYLQGYYISKPLPTEGFINYILEAV